MTPSVTRRSYPLIASVYFVARRYFSLPPTYVFESFKDWLPAGVYVPAAFGGLTLLNGLFKYDRNRDFIGTFEDISAFALRDRGTEAVMTIESAPVFNRLIQALTTSTQRLANFRQRRIW